MRHPLLPTAWKYSPLPTPILSPIFRSTTNRRQQVQPDEIYNLGAMSHVKVSFEMSEYTAEADGVGVLRLLNAIRSAGLEKKTRLYQVRLLEPVPLVLRLAEPCFLFNTCTLAKLCLIW